MGTHAWEEARVLNGVPATGAELTEAYNPLEAGLYHACSLAKGCYIGQETISKVHNANGVLSATFLHVKQNHTAIMETGTMDTTPLTSCLPS
jgi:folate-binding protein YgfZ